MSIAPPMEQTARTVRAPRGTQISCKGWQQEAALRMLMNNLDPEVAENPAELIVYGGSGKAARSWADYDRIVGALKDLENDETLLVQSGRAVGVIKTEQRAGLRVGEQQSGFFKTLADSSNPVAAPLIAERLLMRLLPGR